MYDTSIFEHKGGFILDSEGKERYWEPDSPGWYFWWKGYHQDWYLFGPYESLEEAEAHQEGQSS